MTSAKHKVKSKGWKRSINISKEKYDPVAKAILLSLTSEPMRFSKVSEEVKKRLPNFSGSVSWYTISILRELERQGKVKRIKKGGIVTCAKT